VPAAAGASPLAALGLSAIVFSGAAQILAVQLLAAGAPLAVIVMTCFVAGLRFVIYSAAMAPYCGRCRRVSSGASRSCSPTRRLPRRCAA
jgi:predicted branched-subunit amino acid permease